MSAADRARERAPIDLDHLPNRTTWQCDDDGQDWPCKVYKRRLWVLNPRDPRAIEASMAGWLVEARAHLPGLSALALHARFVAWVREWPGQ